MSGIFRTFRLDGGIEIAALEWGDGPVVLLHHANGFCAAMWTSVAERLAAHACVIAIDARGHGRSSKPEGLAFYDWHRLIEDLLGVSEQLVSETGAPIALAAGNSFGGTLSMCAAARRPVLFERVAMLDPVLVPSPELFAAHGIEFDLAALPPRPNIAEQARKRRAVWPSRDTARDSWSRKEMFARWQPRALELYLEHGLCERGDGRLELSCPPHAEAAVFEMTRSLDPFEFAEHVRAPTTVVEAELGHFPGAVFQLMADSLPRGRKVSLPAGHLLPMEAPEATADLLLECLKEDTE